MKICQPHWNKLREAIKVRGLDHLGAKNGQEAMAAVVTELEGRGAENDFDPLMSCNNMIFAQWLKLCGLQLMTQKEDGSERCPICEVVASYEQWWIDGPANEALQTAIEEGLVPRAEAPNSTDQSTGDKDAVSA